MIKKILAIGIAVLAIGLMACGQQPNSAVNRDKEITNQQLEIYAKSQPVPVFDYSQTRASLIQIYSAKTHAVSTWSVFVSLDGRAIFSCPSIGFPIPADTQLTNPTQRLTGHEVTVAQAEPDGTYTSANTNGTYVLCVRPNGKVSAVYSEPTVLTFPFEVKVVDGKIVDVGGEASFGVDIKK